MAFVGYRARTARRAIGLGCRQVLAIGWTRSPDTSHYAVFPLNVPDHTSEPELVVRLAKTQRSRSGPMWLCGSARPAQRRSVALFDDDGNVLGYGRVLPQPTGLTVWQRRLTPTPWWARNTAHLNQPPDS